MALSALTLASFGCIQEPVRGPAGDGGFIFRGPEDLDSMFVDSGTFHSVKLLFEIDPATDLPRGEDYSRIVHELDPAGEVSPDEEFRVRVVPRFEGNREVYRVGDLHEVVYAFREFEVGRFRYPAEPGAWLFVLKPRRGALEITYRTQRIRAEVRGEWKPAIWFLREKGRDESGPWAVEHLWIGLAKLRLDSREPTWDVEGEPYAPGSSDVLVLSGATGFDAR